MKAILCSLCGENFEDFGDGDRFCEECSLKIDSIIDEIADEETGLEFMLEYEKLADILADILASGKIKTLTKSVLKKHLTYL